MKYKYTRDNFCLPEFHLLHMELYINFIEPYVEVTNHLFLKSLVNTSDIVKLNARQLEVLSVKWLGFIDNENKIGTKVEELKLLEEDIKFRVDGENNLLIVELPYSVRKDCIFVIKTVTRCYPSDHILEGIYKDVTYPGFPQQYMSQCQQWGFQRIAPVIDDCTAKCTYFVTIEADYRYTHLISNGDIWPVTNPDKKPCIIKKGDQIRKIIVYRNMVKMPPYLFIVCAGTWDELVDEVVYDSGKKIRLEYLVPKGRIEGARLPMKILKEAILWQNREEGYEYPFEVYRIICMEKSNYGGMENLGNTTIITDAALVDEFTPDNRLIYTFDVIIHEFEHNQCGSEVTMQTPFDMWLNEAYTVDVSRRFLEYKFGKDYMRLYEVETIRSPITGPLAIEGAGYMGRIVRDGFNDPDELVDSVTYVKASEVIRMLRLLIGEVNFKNAMKRYFKVYSGGNANTEDFFKCVEETINKDLKQFKENWLYRRGYPVVTGEWSYDEHYKKLKLIVKQRSSGEKVVFHFPLAIAAVDSDGRIIESTDRVLEINRKINEFEFFIERKPSFISWNREYSFYGIFKEKKINRRQLFLQVEKDPSVTGKVEAMRFLTDMERIRLIKDISLEVRDDWLDLYLKIMENEDIHPGVKAYMLHIDEMTLDRKFLPKYRQRYAAREKILISIAKRFYDLLKKKIDETSDSLIRAGEEIAIQIPLRHLKAVLMRVITAADTPEVHKMLIEEIYEVRTFTEKLNALKCLMFTSFKSKRHLLDNVFISWRDNPKGYISYLSVIGMENTEDAFEWIKIEENRPQFCKEHPAHLRALYLGLACNNKLVWTERGIEWLTSKIIEVAKINEYVANLLLQIFQYGPKLDSDLQALVKEALIHARANINPEKQPSVAGRIDLYLSGFK